MSHFDYEQSLKAVGEGLTFRALIMAAMRRGNTEAVKKLRWAFPQMWTELQARSKTKDGKLEGES
jgi:hypothetical protein